MSTIERRARDRQQLQQRILDTARDLFVAHGYDGVTLRRIAEAIEYAPGTIYGYYKDKDALIQALCLADFEAFEKNFPRGAPPTDPIEAIEAIGKAYIDFALSHPNHYRLMFMTRRPVTPPAEAMKDADDPARNGYALLRKTVQRAIDAGRLRSRFRDADLAAQTLWAGVHGMASLQIAMGDDPGHAWTPVESRVAAMIDAMFHGIAHRDAPGTSP